MQIAVADQMQDGQFVDWGFTKPEITIKSVEDMEDASLLRVF